VRRLLAAGVVAAALAAAGCRGDQGPRAGELAVRLATPRTGQRAVSFVLVGPLDAVSAPSGSGYRLFSVTSADGDTAYVAVVAPSGTGLAPGAIARFGVPDVQRLDRYRVTLTDAATAAYAVGDTAGLVLSVYHP
jgi:hypothetical protein